MEPIRPTHPKVFISYAWAKNKSRANDIADRLMNEGIDVVIDIYDLVAGKNKYAYMQKMVSDATIEKVLMLCDEEYKCKADNFEGGVGDEATIISPEVYGKVEQTKFIPIVLERDKNGEPYLPQMVKSIIYFDLSDPQSEADEFKRLVRNLWGMPDRRKPLLAQRPKWLDSPSVNTTGIEAQLKLLESSMRVNPDANAVLVRTAHEFQVALNDLAKPESSGGDLIKMIEQMESIRNCFVSLVEQGIMLNGFTGERIASLIEKLYNDVKIDINRYWMSEAYHFFFWELFICTTALMIEYERFDMVHALLDRTYFLRNMIGTNNDPEPYTFSEFRQVFRRLEGEYKDKINPRLVSLAANMLVNREFGLSITKRNLVVADITLAHLAMLYGRANFSWYPVLAPYAHSAGYDLIWNRLVSRAYCEKVYPLFAVGDIGGLRDRVREMSDLWKGDEISRCGGAFGGIPTVLWKMEVIEIGSRP